MAAKNGKVVLILGGARGGKSTFAEELAAELGSDVLFVATAEAHDDAMRQRIEAHRRARPPHWRTLEAPVGTAAAIAANGRAEVVLLDCLTMLVSNLLGRAASEDPQEDGTYDALRDQVLREVNELVAWQREAGAHLIVVSNEVGMGLVPPYPLGRAFRDLLGSANRRLALAADEVYLMVAGIPVEVKELARRRLVGALGDE